MSTPGPMMRRVMFLKAQDKAMALLTNHLSRGKKAGAGRTKRRKKFIHPLKDD